LRVLDCKYILIYLKALDRECYEDAIKQLVLEGFLLRNGDKARVVGIDDSNI